MYPGFGGLIGYLEKLKETFGDDPTQFAGRVDGAEASLDYIWQNYGRDKVETTFNQLKEKSGIGDLPKGLQNLARREFTAFVSTEANRTRYISSDPSLLDEFVDQFNTDVIQPLRQTQQVEAAAKAVSRTRVPRGGGSGTSVSQADPGATLSGKARVRNAVRNAVQRASGGTVS